MFLEDSTETALALGNLLFASGLGAFQLGRFSSLHAALTVLQPYLCSLCLLPGHALEGQTQSTASLYLRASETPTSEERMLGTQHYWATVSMCHASSYSNCSALCFRHLSDALWFRAEVSQRLNECLVLTRCAIWRGFENFKVGLAELNHQGHFLGVVPCPGPLSASCLPLSE